MAKKDKKKTVDKKARVAEKTARKSATKEKKSSKKAGGKDVIIDATDQDIDAVLEEYARKQAQFLKVTETVLDGPPPLRSGPTLTASPASASELFLFGGETFNGSLAAFFNDLNIYNTATGSWRCITSPNSPLPRSGHWVCATQHAGGTLWLFGGEFSSPKQNTFYHYNDFWSFECKTREWARVEVKGKAPPARSGHRMVGWKNLVVLWGGFQDTSASTKYLGDLWVFNVVSYTWTQVVLPAHGQRPDARSSFSLLPHEQGAVLFGGYSKTKVASAQKKGGGKMAVSEIGNVHEDSWLLRLDQEDMGKIRWERRKKPGNAPNPKRVGVTMAPHKGRGIMFGGVHDKAETDEGLDSIFFNELYAWSVERNRFFPLALRKARQQKRMVEQRGGRRDRGREAEEELFKNLARLEAEQAGKSAEEMREEEERKKADEEKERLAILQQSELTLNLPTPRMHCALAVQDDVLYIYGGTFEKEDREIAYDELFAIDLGKLDGVRTVFSRQTETEWVDSESEDDEDDEDDEEDSEEEEEEEEEVNEKKPKISEAELEERRAEKAKKKARTAPAIEVPAESPTAEDQEEPEHPAAEDPAPHPRPFESLREFYARTSNEWQQLLIEQAEAEGKNTMKTVKELKKDAFAIAEEKWWDCREEIRALEDEQEEAGIGEVVSLADKSGGGGGGGVGRRR
ncbi:hypothetical protein BZA05DRAFT_411960 [Tricharina praecox]|uniref:uncharacterized protein n=1 Tax=Tricharina praecox TaxID=43433 RepID=UPI00221F5FA1|nr:uncharacterized protein BZA05DRAFT_411960 [Tricharina praecox]KAI5842689.1 hypothetical protein BZA05DRAFT_411960 [Tricharina praecox]